jgi:hypothetical protein
MKHGTWGVWLAAALVVGGGLLPSSASACGGFFCSQAQPVNQAAERIVFAHHGDGTVTAVIEIQYINSDGVKTGWSIVTLTTICFGCQHTGPVSNLKILLS